MSFEPKTSKEKYLATQAGLYDGDLPAPKTNEEYYLKEMAENPSSGGGIFIVNVVHDETLNKDTLDKNYAEIDAAYSEGKAVFTKKDTRAAVGGFLSVRPIIGISSGVMGNSEVYMVIANNELGANATTYFISHSATGVLFEPDDASGNEDSGNDDPVSEGPSQHS